MSSATNTAINNQENHFSFEEKELSDTQGCWIISADTAYWNKIIKKFENKFINETQIPGFRKGHAPANIVQEKLKQAQTEILLNASKTLINEMHKFALNYPHKKIQAHLWGGLETKINELTPTNLKVEFIFDLEPKVKIGDWKSISITPEKNEVKENDIKAEINRYLEMQAMTKTNNEKKLENGDTAVIWFNGKIDGKEFEGGKAENYQLKIGSKSFIDNFEDQLIGMKPGQDKVIKVKFPEDYAHKQFAGKEAEFEVGLTEIKITEIPELNEEVIKKMNIENVSNYEQLKHHIHQHLLKTQKTKIEEKTEEDALTAFVNLVDLKISEKIIKEEQQRIIKELQESLKQQNFSYEMYLKMMGTNVEQFELECKNEALNRMKLLFGLQTVAKQENIKLEENDWDEVFFKLSAAQKKTVKEVRDLYRNNVDFSIRLLNEKTWKEIRKQIIKS